MLISLYGMYFLPYIKKCLEEEGHSVFLNEFSKDIEVCIIESRFYMYDIYRHLKLIKKNKIKLINFILDIPIWPLQKNYVYNNINDYLKQFLYNIFHKNQFFLKNLNQIASNLEDNKYHNIISQYLKKYCYTPRYNHFYFMKNYRKYLKYSDLNLSLSKYTLQLVKKYLRIDNRVCYPCVNSDYLLNLQKDKIEYDAINISRIVPYKRQRLFVEAANQLGLKVIVLGRHADKKVKLNCPHFYISDHKEVMKILNRASFYVAPTIFEGFGMTSVEAAFLDKPIIASDIYVHRDVLGDYPIYFKRDNIQDLIEKMKLLLNNTYERNNSEIKKRYSINALKERIIENVETII